MAAAPTGVAVAIACVVARWILTPAWRSSQCEDEADDYYGKTIIFHGLAPSKAGSPFDLENEGLIWAVRDPIEKREPIRINAEGGLIILTR